MAEIYARLASLEDAGLVSPPEDPELVELAPGIAEAMGLAAERGAGVVA